MTALCLALAAGAVLATVPVPDGTFALSWRHSVEKTVWREEYRIRDDDLLLVRASVEGSGAGMDPPPGSRLEDGAWVWEPDLAVPSVGLAHSAFGGDYGLCAGGTCRPLSDIVPQGAEGGLVLAPCEIPPAQ